ncbi:hypothetical protein [Pseudoxanthomonas winnipegensis]|uniref:phage adaptor protein n=1 Tax=Pseudoxanthomonas winnipegensis TaxID=2480810 RepID=UPI00102DBF2F|nr:hypothetical protein [Pseudoxanthomonas winnipegensis]RZZ85684.1 hypothetical protein EA663_11790 [Pseudoxanthomonas winnipegensis]
MDISQINCDCQSETYGNQTLKELRGRLMSRLGYGAQVAAPPPGMKDLLNDFLQASQRTIYERTRGYFQLERYFSWPLTAGVRLYDLMGNEQACDKRLNPSKITWVGIEKDGIFRPLCRGIEPRMYSTDETGIPERYEIRECIEIWPRPDETEGQLVIKGMFGLDDFAEDLDRTTIDSELVFLLALANAKSHYRQPDAQTYYQQLEVMLQNIVAGSHQTARYVPGDRAIAPVYVLPKPTVPFA